MKKIKTSYVRVFLFYQWYPSRRSLAVCLNDKAYNIFEYMFSLEVVSERLVNLYIDHLLRGVNPRVNLIRLLLAHTSTSHLFAIAKTPRLFCAVACMDFHGHIPVDYLRPLISLYNVIGLAVSLTFNSLPRGYHSIPSTTRFCRMVWGSAGEETGVIIGLLYSFQRRPRTRFTVF